MTTCEKIIVAASMAVVVLVACWLTVPPDDVAYPTLADYRTEK